ncbi:MAG: DUF362 domain-containing protein [Candidatus Omnitrophica bacterium]|nr:DUF362 domain-containing protein [Candidatus Omnitrophota bacterium]
MSVKLKRLFGSFVRLCSFIVLIFRPYADNEIQASSEPLPGEHKNIPAPFYPPKNSKIISLPQQKQVVTTEVSIIKGYNLYSITREAIDAIGGMKSIVKKGNKVFIKPNYVSGGLNGHDPVTTGEIAHPEVVASVAEECLKAGAKEVIIGEWVERPYKINFGGEEGKDGAQVKHLIDLLNKKYGHKIYLINLMDHTTNFKYFPSRTKLGFLAIPDIVAEADVIISIPSLKTHHKPCPVSLGMKNFMGIMPSIFYGEPRYKLHEAGVHQVIVDINQALKPSLVVIDGSFGMEKGGASVFLGGKPVDVSKRIGGFLVIAGRDPVATDATATRLITKDWGPRPEDSNLGTPWYVHHLRMASEQGLGVLDASRIIIKGESLKSVEMNWQASDDGVYPEIKKDENPKDNN